MIGTHFLGSKKGSKSKTKRVENEKLSDLIRDYKELVVEQQSADTNSTSEDIDVRFYTW